MSAQLKVVIAEPSAIAAEGLRSIIESAGGFRVAAVVGDISILDERLKITDADIVVINPSLLDRRSVHNLKAAFPALHNVKSMALVYSIFDDELLRQFDAVAKIVDTPSSIVSQLRHIVSADTDTRTDTAYDLTDREREILVSVARGRTNKEIADEYSISIHTVISHRKNITRKTGIKSVAGLTVYALLNNMIDKNDME